MARLTMNKTMQTKDGLYNVKVWKRNARSRKYPVLGDGSWPFGRNALLIASSAKNSKPAPVSDFIKMPFSKDGKKRMECHFVAEPGKQYAIGIRYRSRLKASGEIRLRKKDEQGPINNQEERKAANAALICTCHLGITSDLKKGEYKYSGSNDIAFYVRDSKRRGFLGWLRNLPTIVLGRKYWVLVKLDEDYNGRPVNLYVYTNPVLI